MNGALKIAVIMGSGREGRFCETVVKWVLTRAETVGGWNMEIVDPADFLAGWRSGRKEWVRQETGRVIADADAFIVVTPEYNHSFTGELKLVIDAFSEEWRDKPVAFVSYGGISGGLRAVEQLRLVFAELRAIGLRETVSFSHAWNRFGADGRPIEAEAAEKAMTTLLRELERWAIILRADREPLEPPARLEAACA